MTCGWNARKGKALDGQFEDVKSVDELMYSDDTRLPEHPLADARALTHILESLRHKYCDP